MTAAAHGYRARTAGPNLSRNNQHGFESRVVGGLGAASQLAILELNGLRLDHEFPEFSAASIREELSLSAAAVGQAICAANPILGYTRPCTGGLRTCRSPVPGIGQKMTFAERCSLAFRSESRNALLRKAL